MARKNNRFQTEGVVNTIDPREIITRKSTLVRVGVCMIVRLCVNYPKGSREPFQNQRSSLSQLACFTLPLPPLTLLPPFWTVYFVVNACGSGSGVETLWLQFWRLSASVVPPYFIGCLGVSDDCKHPTFN